MLAQQPTTLKMPPLITVRLARPSIGTRDAGTRSKASGRRGDGAGGDVPPQWIAGSLTPSDYPVEVRGPGVRDVVGVRFVVSERGNVRTCTVTRSSGSRVLDDATCRLIMERYRYRPGHDAAGVPFEVTIVKDEKWTPPGKGQPDAVALEPSGMRGAMGELNKAWTNDTVHSTK